MMIFPPYHTIWLYRCDYVFLSQLWHFLDALCNCYDSVIGASFMRTVRLYFTTLSLQPSRIPTNIFP
jgi:hypothetical protein